jgi:hypothetical protein
MQILLVTCTKGWVGGRSTEGITGSKPAGGMDVSCECYVLSGTGLCDGPITVPEESYRVWCVYLCVTSIFFNVQLYENTR